MEVVQRRREKYPELLGIVGEVAIREEEGLEIVGVGPLGEDAEGIASEGFHRRGGGRKEKPLKNRIFAEGRSYFSEVFGADRETRTLTPLLAQASETCVSTIPPCRRQDYHMQKSQKIKLFFLGFYIFEK